MNRLVKILLTILAVLLIAAGGFWSGTRFAYQQAAGNSVRQAVNAAPGGMPDFTKNQASQNDNGPQANAAQDDNQPGFRQSGRNSSGGPGMMWSDSRQRNNFDQNRQSFDNSGPRNMPRFGQGNEPGGMMTARQNNGGTSMFAGGGFMGGAFMLFGLLFPLGFGILMVLGIIVLFRMVRQPSPAPVAASAPCAKCGASLQSGWGFCPHCGEAIQK